MNNAVKSKSMHRQDKNHEGFELYDANFYKKNIKTENAATAIINYLSKTFKFNSVLDIGCGRGAWLMAAKSSGATTLFGVDGPWNSRKDMPDDDIEFISVNLEEDFRSQIPRKFDLCISLEVAEHLPIQCSESFVNSLCDTSDAILFSAAFIGQGGTGHVNENLHSFWAEIFARKGYVVFDAIRPIFWGNKSIDFWYQQNIFLYIKKNSTSFNIANNNSMPMLNNIAFMNAIHPDLYINKCEHRMTTRDLIMVFPRSLKNTLSNRIERMRAYFAVRKQ